MSEHLTDKAPLRLHLRIAFHDWMWSGGDDCGWRRRLARRLPLYFTDPYLDGIPRDPDKFRRWLASLPKAEVVTSPPSNLTFDYVTGKFYPTPQTWGSSSLRWTR